MKDTEVELQWIPVQMGTAKRKKLKGQCPHYMSRFGMEKNLVTTVQILMAGSLCVLPSATSLKHR